MTIGPRVTQPPAGMPGGALGTRSDGVAGAEWAKPFGGRSVVVGVASAGMPMPGGAAVEAEIEADITTSDALGDQFKAAFCLSAPTMPEELRRACDDI